MNDPKQEGHDVPISGHEYDGIQEFDNQLPRWWVYMFYLSIAFAAVYFVYYTLGPGPSTLKVFNEDRAKIDASRASPDASGAPQFTEAELKAAFNNPEEVAKGKLIFGIRCASCHGEQAQGNVGPNLTDEYWLHGGSISEVAKTVNGGVVEKGMPAWGKVMKPAGIIRVVAYVKSLKNSHPPNPKAPQGQLYKGD